jgi:hypothetical protein
MDMFNAKSRRNPKMDNWTDISKPGFGGPKEKQDFDKSKREFLKGYQRVVDRNADFEGGKTINNYDTTWKAVSRDTVSRQAGKKPFDPMYSTPLVRATTEKIEEGRIFRFEEFMNENFEEMMNGNEEMPTDDMPMDDMPMDEKPELDEEKLEALIEEFGDQMKEMIDEICEKMEMEKDECCDYICAAIEKVCKAEDEEEGEENEESEEEEEDEDK